MIKVVLTVEQAEALWLNVDGLLDAGACNDGLSDADREVLQSVCDQISAQKKAPTANAERMRRARASEMPEQANQRRQRNRDRMRAARGGKP